MKASSWSRAGSARAFRRTASAGQEACTCNLAAIVKLSEPTVTHHLKKLEASGLLTKQRRGMNVYYRGVPEAIHAIAATLHVNCC